MNPAKVKRDGVRKLTDLPNVGPSIAGDLVSIGVASPPELTGRDPFSLYQDLCLKSGVRQDPCVLDVFISITRFMDGGPPLPWWSYTEERKRRYGAI